MDASATVIVVAAAALSAVNAPCIALVAASKSGVPIEIALIKLAPSEKAAFIIGSKLALYAEFDPKIVLASDIDETV